MATDDPRVCRLCGGGGEDGSPGRLLYLRGAPGAWLHANCVLWSAEVWESDDGVLHAVHAALARSFRLVRRVAPATPVLYRLNDTGASEPATDVRGRACRNVWRVRGRTLRWAAAMRAARPTITFPVRRCVGRALRTCACRQVCMYACLFVCLLSAHAFVYCVRVPVCVRVCVPVYVPVCAT
jgi:hypothetical protein